MKNCPQCSKAFSAKRATARYCSDKCRNLAFRSDSVAVSVAKVSVADNETLKKDSVATVKHTLIELPEDIIPVVRDGKITDELVTVHPDGLHCEEHCKGKVSHCAKCRS